MLVVSLFSVLIGLSFVLIRSYVQAMESSEVEKNYNNYQAAKFIDDISFKNGVTEKAYRLSDAVELQYKWSLTDQKKGDTLVYDIPKEMYIVNDLDFNLLTKSGSKIGEVELRSEENQLEVKFTDPDDLMKKNKEINGTFYFTVKLAPDYWVGKAEKTIDFPMGEVAKKLTITIQSEGQAAADELIFGWGIYNKREKMVDWDLRINHAEKNMAAASVQINVGTTSKIDTTSFKLFEIKDNDLIESEKAISQSIVGDNLVLSIENVSKSYLLSFKAQSDTKKATLSASLANYGTTLAETGDIPAFYTTGSSILEKTK